MKLLCVMSTGDLGGAELALLTQIDHCSEELSLRAVVPFSGPVAQHLRSRGIAVSSAAHGDRPRLMRAGLSARLVWSQVRNFRPDIVYAVGNRAATLCAPISSRHRVPLVWSKPDLILAPRQTALLSSRCAGVIVPSMAAAVGVPARLRAVIPPPVRLPYNFLIDDDRPPATLSCLGRLEPTKGQADLVEAAGQLRTRYPEIRVLLAGGEPPYARGYREKLRDLARGLGMTDSVHFLGWVDSIESVFEQSTVYVQPSFATRRTGGEGFSAAVAEASWAGLPVVVSQIGGTSDAVRDGITGTLVPPRQPTVLAEAIARYIDQPTAAKVAGSAGSRFARERFEPKAVAAAWLASLYRFLQDSSHPA